MKNYGSEQSGMSVGAGQTQHGHPCFDFVVDRLVGHGVAFARFAARRDASPYREASALEQGFSVLVGGGFAGNGRGLRPRTPAGLGYSCLCPRTPAGLGYSCLPPRTPAGLCHFCCLGAEGGGEAIHDVAASAQILAGIGRALRKAAQDQQAVGGEFAGIFGRRIVAWRQGE